MAASALSSFSSRVLLLVLLLVAVTRASEHRVPITTTVTTCYPATNSTNGTKAFRADVLSLLDAIPSAAAPMGFASLRSTGSAFVRGLCFDVTTPTECRRCLTAAARNLTSSCGADSHLAGVWTDGCFLSYAEANATTPGEDAQRSRVISGPADALARSASDPVLQWFAAAAQLVAPRAALNDETMMATSEATYVPWDYALRSTVRVLAQCARDRTAAECDRCLEHSAQEAATCCWGLDPWRDGVAAAVLGFNCYLRFEVSTVPVPLRHRIVTQNACIEMMADDHPFLTGVLIFVVGMLVLVALDKICRCCMERKARANARNAAASAAAAAAAAAGPGARVELVHVGQAQA